MLQIVFNCYNMTIQVINCNKVDNYTEVVKTFDNEVKFVITVCKTVAFNYTIHVEAGHL